jgi:hypothetical protein
MRSRQGRYTIRRYRRSTDLVPPLENTGYHWNLDCGGQARMRTTHYQCDATCSVDKVFFSLRYKYRTCNDFLSRNLANSACTSIRTLLMRAILRPHHKFSRMTTVGVFRLLQQSCEGVAEPPSPRQKKPDRPDGCQMRPSCRPIRENGVSHHSLIVLRKALKLAQLEKWRT